MDNPQDKRRGQGGFLVIEILIAGLILTASIASTMYLFRIGLESLQRVKESNIIASKVPQAINYLKASAIKDAHGSESLGDGVSVSWDTELERHGTPSILINTSTQYDIYLYRVNFKLTYNTLKRDYQVVLFKYKAKSDRPDEVL
ncbi:MAG: hypothetical protein HQL01_13475 [Nitrospirae bacterium]|nr:hypothetical protein [Nitrospirota bacterium]